LISFVLNPGFQACDALLDDPETKDLLEAKFNLLILDGAFPECALGLQYRFNVPFMYVNTVGFFTGSTSGAGSPAPYSITPHFSVALTDDMNFVERVTNTFVHVLLTVIHSVSRWLNAVDLFTFHQPREIGNIFLHFNRFSTLINMYMLICRIPSGAWLLVKCVITAAVFSRLNMVYWCICIAETEKFH
jgi:UDP-glucoronosyl and UDP-glucosyl transferase